LSYGRQTSVPSASHARLLPANAACQPKCPSVHAAHTSWCVCSPPAHCQPAPRLFHTPPHTPKASRRRLSTTHATPCSHAATTNTTHRSLPHHSAARHLAHSAPCTYQHQQGWPMPSTCVFSHHAPNKRAAEPSLGPPCPLPYLSLFTNPTCEHRHKTWCGVSYLPQQSSSCAVHVLLLLVPACTLALNSPLALVLHPLLCNE